MKHQLACISIIVWLLASCGQPQKQVIEFNITFNNKIIDCAAAIENSNVQWQIEQLFFYVSQVQLKNTAQQWQPVSLATNKYQAEQVALLGVECGGKEPANWQLTLAKDQSLTKVTALRFTLGLPFSINHKNPLSQASPLNIPTMFWIWQTGHKFVRFELAAAEQAWLFHLGSTGCSSASALRAPNTTCVAPNLFTFELPLENNSITLDIGTWFNGVHFSDKTTCQSAPENLVCQHIFANLNVLAK